MADYVLTTEPLHLNFTGTAFMVYANRYRDAAMACLASPGLDRGFDPVPYQLLCQSLELHLKSFIWLKDQIDWKKIRNKYNHNLEKLWEHSKDRGIHRFASVTPLRDRTISLVGPYYKERQFNYLDLAMTFEGFSQIKSEPRIIPTLSRLTLQLRKSLRTPILRAS